MNLVTVQEVFGIAIQIEQHASEFYRQAAEKLPTDLSDDLLRLAKMEEQHKELFMNMRDALPAQQQGAAGGDLRDEGELFMAALMSSYRVEGSPSAAQSLTGAESLKDILRTGLSLEKESVLLYLGIKDAVAGQEAKDAIQNIIDEEKSHIVVFAKELERLG